MGQGSSLVKSTALSFASSSPALIAEGYDESYSIGSMTAAPILGIIIPPIMLPMLAKFDINSLHFGLLMTMNLGIGYVTPPVGGSLYIASAIAKRDLMFVVRAVLPFIILQIIILALLTYVPDLSLSLPKVFYKEAVEAGYAVGMDESGGI